MIGDDAFIKSLVHDGLENRSNPILLRLPENPFTKELLQNFSNYHTLISGYIMPIGVLADIVSKRLKGDNRSPIEIADDLELEKVVLSKDGLKLIIKDYIRSSKNDSIDVLELENKELIKDLTELTKGHFGPVTLLKMFYEVLEESE